MSEFSVAFVLLALALYRLALLFTRDAGPFQIFQRLRTRLGVYDYDASGAVRGTLGQLFGCPYCLGVWLAVGAVGVLYFFPLQPLHPAWWVVTGFALAGAQTLLQQAHDALARIGEDPNGNS